MTKTMGLKEAIDLVDNMDGLNFYKEENASLSEKLGNLEADYDDLIKENKELKHLIKKVIDERVIDYPLLQELKEVILND